MLLLDVTLNSKMHSTYSKNSSSSYQFFKLPLRKALGTYRSKRVVPQWMAISSAATYWRVTLCYLKGKTAKILAQVTEAFQGGWLQSSYDELPNVPQLQLQPCCSFFKLFSYFWLCCVFIAMHRLSLVVANGNYSSLWCVGFSLW